jgi:radical SAM-linked protein
MDGHALSRYRAAFHKAEAMRYTGNLDLHRTLERMVRRAGLPLAYTQGYHPHPRLTLACALALGCTSEAELAEFWLEGAIPAGEVLARCREASPSGIHVTAVAAERLEDPSLPTLVVSAEYEAALGTEAIPQDLATRTAALLARDSIPRTRREKSYDLRPLIEALDVDSRADGGLAMRMRLAAREAATGRPEEVLLALGLEPAAARIHRVRLILREPQPA